MGRLAQLAANPQGATREEIFLAVASLYRVQGSHLSARERDLMRDILRRLARDVEMAIRIALAERLADDITAPHDLILLLADDTIEVARPLILRSALLTEADVLRMIAECGMAHHEVIAARAYIGEPVTEALARSEAESVLAALVRNVTAKISSATFETLVEKSRRIASLQSPLVERPDLPPRLATKMCDFVSEALRIYISQNFNMAPEKLDRALRDAEKSVSGAPGAVETAAGGSQRLVDKLAACGQLKPGFLLRVLQQGQIELFDMAFAQLLRLPLAEHQSLFYQTGPRSVALACRAVGIDRCVFSTVFERSRRARRLVPQLSNEQLAEVQAVFNSYTKAEALDELRAGPQGS